MYGVREFKHGLARFQGYVNMTVPGTKTKAPSTGPCRTTASAARRDNDAHSNGRPLYRDWLMKGAA